MLRYEASDDGRKVSNFDASVLPAGCRSSTGALLSIVTEPAADPVRVLSTKLRRFRSASSSPRVPTNSDAIATMTPTSDFKLDSSWTVRFSDDGACLVRLGQLRSCRVTGPRGDNRPAKRCFSCWPTRHPLEPGQRGV